MRATWDNQLLDIDAPAGGAQVRPGRGAATAAARAKTEVYPFSSNPYLPIQTFEAVY
jgi:hypothetical protein